MIFMNVILSFIFQRCCLGFNVAQKVGYLFEGEVEDLQYNFVGVQGYIISKNVNHETYLVFLKEQYTLDFEKRNAKDKNISFRYIMCDTNKKYWKKKNSFYKWNFYHTFKVKECDGNYYKTTGIRIPMRYIWQNNNDEIYKIYKMTLMKISMIFWELMVLFVNDKTDFNKKVNSYKQLNEITDNQAIEENKDQIDAGVKLLNIEVLNGELHDNVILENKCTGMYDAREELLKQIDFLCENNVTTVDKKTDLNILTKKFYMKLIKSIANYNNKTINNCSKEEKFTHIRNYYALMNEFSLFWGHDWCSNYSLTDQSPRYMIERINPVIILIVTFSKDKTIEKKNIITHQDIIYYCDDEKIEIDQRSTLIRYFPESCISLITLIRKNLREKKINFISINGYPTIIDISDSVNK